MKRLLLFLIPIGLMLPAVIRADVITVSGEVSGVWSVDTVLVVGEIRIPPGETLIIQPGVEVLFQVYCKFIIDNGATLIAAGTSAQPILFDEYSPGTGWHGLRFTEASSASRLEHCRFRHGLASGSWENSNGGAVFLSDSSPSIRRCVFDGNEARWCGGAISCSGSSPQIRDNIFYSNIADYGGAVSCSYSSHPTIRDNLIIENRADSSYGFGGAISTGMNCDPEILGNVIWGNSASRGGGLFAGFFCDDFKNGLSAKPRRYPALSGNAIVGNWALYGGGVYCVNSEAPFIGNNISRNVSSDDGAAVYCSEGGHITLLNNAISANQTPVGGAVYCYYANPTIVNCIFWNNLPAQIHAGSGSSPLVNYCDVQGGWPGLGNMDEDPLFVDPALNDVRLQWDSPCIDAGNPDPIYNDPDGTQADMGAFYFDQSVPVRILLTPHEIAYLIPESGGIMAYTIRATNIDSIAHNVTVWCDVTLPDSTVVGPILGPVIVTLGAGLTVDRQRTQAVPAAAPMGIYNYNAYAVVNSDTSRDSFMFGKLGASGGDGSSDWANYGELITGRGDSRIAPTGIPEKIHLGPNYPNPFNPLTTIRFSLSRGIKVDLAVYDLSGRKVTTLVSGWRERGEHEVTFDGSEAASGIYIYRLMAEGFEESGKMVLMK